MAEKNSMSKANGDLATFVVHVKFNEHSTWQGEVTWLDKKEKRSFRSALELLKLMDSALDEDDDYEEGRA